MTPSSLQAAPVEGTPLKHLMPGWFGIVMGWCGLALAWHRAHDQLGGAAARVLGKATWTGFSGTSGTSGRRAATGRSATATGRDVGTSIAGTRTRGGSGLGLVPARMPRSVAAGRSTARSLVALTACTSGSAGTR